MVLLPHPARERTPIRIALTGANGGYGRTLLAQLRRTPEILPAVLVDPDIAGVRRMLDDLAIEPDSVTVIPDASGLDWSGLDVLVEASGRVSAGFDYAATALANGTHVVMVSKEVDSVVGPDLARRARLAGLSYLAGDGDQPANLLRLVDWVSAVGLDIVAIGKSGEYDLEFDPTTGRVVQSGVTVDAPGLADLLDLGDDVSSTLAARASLVAPLKRAAAADSCEMTVVASRTGMTADVEAMHYPVARIDELADIYASIDDGGIVARDGVVDVFSGLRLPGEASFAGGIFAIVRTGDPVTWEILRGKGHVLSRDGRYACIYWPYHFMGVETPLTIHAAVDSAPALTPAWTTILAARTQDDLPAGTAFAVAGHHHEIAGVAPVMIDPAASVAPYYLLDGARLRHAIPAGELVRLEDLEGVADAPLAAYLAGTTLNESNGAHR
ncbi:homoserine dehydrogenase [Microbacterium sp. P06]|uniref:homoserine dehydrogenase n=1 Tax=Microbacterium sp. P06 TaxID=3366949 RepID=UPI00374714DE